MIFGRMAITVGLLCAALVGSACFFGRWQSSTELAYICTRHFQQHICLIDADRGFSFEFAANVEYQAFDITWSPDGDSLAFTAYINGAAPGIYIMSVQDTQPQPIAPLGGGPAWSPDGTQIIYTMFQQAKTQLFSVTPVSDPIPIPTLLTEYPGYIYNLAWSPDGTHIAWQQRGADSEFDFPLFTARADGTDIRQLTEDESGYRYFDPEWSPDGTQIAAVHATNDWHGIVVLDANGQIERQFPAAYYVYTGSPTWSPDGQRIAFDFGSQARLLVT